MAKVLVVTIVVPDDDLEEYADFLDRNCVAGCIGSSVPARFVQRRMTKHKRSFEGTHEAPEAREHQGTDD